MATQGGLLERAETQRAEPGDHDRFSHYAKKAELADAMILGIPVKALCGKVWVPSRDPEKFPVRPACKEVWLMMEAGQ